jgi:hypothetical protein
MADNGTRGAGNAGESGVENDSHPGKGKVSVRKSTPNQESPAAPNVESDSPAKTSEKIISEQAPAEKSQGCQSFWILPLVATLAALAALAALISLFLAGVNKSLRGELGGLKNELRRLAEKPGDADKINGEMRKLRETVSSAFSGGSLAEDLRGKISAETAPLRKSLDAVLAEMPRLAGVRERIESLNSSLKAENLGGLLAEARELRRAFDGAAAALREIKSKSLDVILQAKEDAEKKLSAVMSDKDGFSRALAQLKAERDAAQKAARDSDARRDAAARELDSVRKESSDAAGTAARLSKELEMLKAEREAARQAVADSGKLRDSALRERDSARAELAAARAEKSGLESELSKSAALREAEKQRADKISETLAEYESHIYPKAFAPGAPLSPWREKLGSSHDSGAVLLRGLLSAFAAMETAGTGGNSLYSILVELARSLSALLESEGKSPGLPHENQLKN